MAFNIAIDGPAGAGKSTIAKKLAADLGYVYVDTGAMYRAMAYYFLQNHIDASDEQAIAAACPKVDVTIQYTGGEQQVILNKENVNGVIRKEEVGNMASATSVYPVVRTKLVELQRQLAAKENVIMDGRDIGTVVLPDANVKIYLTASSKVRAKRRFDELTAKGVSCDMDAIEKDIIERDYRDMHRETSPLKQADDAVLLDSSDLDIDGVVEEMKKIIKTFDNKKTILLHSCCGPCSSSVIERLKSYFDITVLYYNPNIEPKEEYEKRLEFGRNLSILAKCQSKNFMKNIILGKTLG